MWKSYPEFKKTPDEWIRDINDNVTRGTAGYELGRALRMMYRENLITREEQKNLWKMIQSTQEDQYLALTAIESKYKLLT
jgi:hypothetical protein